MTTKTGTLYGIGVRPGDPELITLKALKVLQRVPHIFASCSTKNTYSLALGIVRCHLNGAGIEHLPFPMTKDPQVLASAWEQNARRVLEVLATGSDAAFVTLGDPLTYSTFGYLLKALKRLNPEVGIVTIPIFPVTRDKRLKSGTIYRFSGELLSKEILLLAKAHGLNPALI